MLQSVRAAEGTYGLGIGDDLGQCLLLDLRSSAFDEVQQVIDQIKSM